MNILKFGRDPSAFSCVNILYWIRNEKVVKKCPSF